MRIIAFLTLTLLGSLSLSAQSPSDIARAAHLANAMYIVKAQGGIGRLSPEPANTKDGTTRFNVDLSVMGEIIPNYLGYKGATATLNDGKFESILFDDGVKLKYQYEDGKLVGIGQLKVWAWEGDKPTSMGTPWGPTATFKKFDFLRTVVKVNYSGNNISLLRGIAELAKAKAIEKIKKTEEVENFRAGYTYDPAQQVTEVALTTYEFKKGTYTKVLSEPFKYTVKALTPNRRVIYKMTNGKAKLVTNYDSKGRKKEEDAEYRFFGFVNNITTYTYTDDQMLANKETMKVYSQGMQLSSVVTDNFKVDYSDPDNPTRTYLGGERHNKAGEKIGERRKGEERKLNPDGSWGSWRKNNKVGR